MERTNPLLVCLMLDEIKLDASFSAWPVHLTLLPWFKIPAEQLKNFIDQIDQLLKNTKAPILNGVKEDHLGRAQRAVTLIDDRSSKLARLHEAVLSEVAENGGQMISKGHLGNKFLPHVTVTRAGLGLEPNSSLRCNCAALVEKRDGQTPNRVLRLMELYA